LVLPFLITLALGAVDIGFVANDTVKLRQAVREVGRRAALASYGRLSCPLVNASVQDPVRATESQKLQCLLRYTALQAGLDARTAVRTVTLDPTTASLVQTQPVFNKAFARGNTLILCAQMNARSQTGVLRSLLANRTVSARVIMRITNDVPNGPGQASEAPIASDWSSCESNL
jgi:Flp pilus assembly protein TadG